MLSLLAELSIAKRRQTCTRAVTSGRRAEPRWASTSSDAHRPPPHRRAVLHRIPGHLLHSAGTWDSDGRLDVLPPTVRHRPPLSATVSRPICRYSGRTPPHHHYPAATTARRAPRAVFPARRRWGASISSAGRNHATSSPTSSAVAVVLTPTTVPAIIISSASVPPMRADGSKSAERPKRTG